MPDQHDEETAEEDSSGTARAASEEKDPCRGDAVGSWLPTTTTTTTTDTDQCRCRTECCCGGGRIGTCIIALLYCLTPLTFSFAIVLVSNPSHDAHVLGLFLVAYTVAVIFGIPCVIIGTYLYEFSEPSA